MFYKKIKYEWKILKIDLSNKAGNKLAGLQVHTIIDLFCCTVMFLSFLVKYMLTF